MTKETIKELILELEWVLSSFSLYGEDAMILKKRIQELEDMLNEWT